VTGNIYGVAPKPVTNGKAFTKEIGRVFRKNRFFLPNIPKTVMRLVFG